MNPKKTTGRGANLNTDSRFEKLQRGLFAIEGIDEANDLLKATQVYIESPKNILSENDSPDVPWRYSINPYQGCEHGCIYCYARNSHNYYGWSAGLDFETKIIAKPDAPVLLEKELLKKNWKVQPIMLSGNTDCYQPLERKMKITRDLLQVFAKYRHPVSIITKNVLVLRDLDILKDLAKDNLVHIAFSITSCDETLRLALEPRTARADKKFDAIAQLHTQGIPTIVMVGPIIPGLNDHELMSIMKRASEAGALSASYTMVRLNGAIGELFTDWLERHFPDKKDAVLNKIRSLHGGQLNDSRWGTRMKGEGKLAEAIRMLFHTGKNQYFQNCVVPEYNLHAFRRCGHYTLF
ncbi:MAG: PA0069 family radical SAM protein [Cyclobacteriaceae bacterium]